MRTLLLLATLLFVPGCSDELPLVEIGDLQGLPIGGFLEPRAAAETAPADSGELPSPEPTEVIASTPSKTPDVEESATPGVAALETASDISSGISSGAAEDSAASSANPSEDEEILLVGFDTLADFEYEVPTTEQVEKGTHKKDQIPEDVLALDGKRVEVEGYMVPMEVEKGMVKSFVLSRSLAGCCFGDWPILNEWVDVVMEEGEGADYVPYAPVLVVGRLTVSEAVDEYGVLSIYRMVAESVEDPW